MDTLKLTPTGFQPQEPTVFPSRRLSTPEPLQQACLLYTSDAADEMD